MGQKDYGGLSLHVHPKTPKPVGLDRTSEIMPEMAALSGQELGHPARLTRRNCAKKTVNFTKKR